MCADEAAVAATGERLRYATALELLGQGGSAWRRCNWGPPWEGRNWHCFIAFGTFWVCAPAWQGVLVARGVGGLVGAAGDPVCVARVCALGALDGAADTEVAAARPAPAAKAPGPDEEIKSVALKHLWRRDDLGQEFAVQGVFAREGHVYIGQGGPPEKSQIDKVELATGKSVWSYPGGSYQPSYPVSNGKVVVFGTSNTPFFIVGLNDPTGKELWRVPTGQQNMSAAVFSGDLVFIASYDKHLHAIDWATGKEKWKTPLGAMSGPRRASPASWSMSPAATASSTAWTRPPARSSRRSIATAALTPTPWPSTA